MTTADVAADPPMTLQTKDTPKNPPVDGPDTMPGDSVGFVSTTEIASQLISYETTGTGPSVPPLPCESELIDIVSGFRSLLLGGLHFRTDNGKPAVRRVAVHLEQLGQRLCTQIRIAMRHSGASKLRLHSAVDEAATSNDPGVEITSFFLNELPRLQRVLGLDVQAAWDRDPAARSYEEIVICYPGIQAVLVFRIAHALLRLGVPYLPRMLSEWAHRETGIDIHPGASIGSRFFIDHGTGVVIGETCVIGRGVTLYQGVTLGAWSFPRDDDGRLMRGARRHPTLEDRVTVYSNATILGGSTVVGARSKIGASVTLSRSVPPNTVVTIENSLLRFREAG